MTPSRLADRLDRERRRRFVGRAAEIGLFEAALDAPDTSFGVLFLYGPGGVGKSALMREYVRVVERAGRTPVLLAGHEVSPSPQPFRDAVAEAVRQTADAGHGNDGSLVADRHVLLIDGFDVLAPLESWLRDRFLPSLPDGVVVVIAGRRRPSPAWLADAGWRDVLRVVSMRNLDPDGTREYLHVEGLPGDVHGQVHHLTRGHPLAMSLLVDAIRRSDPPGRVPRALAEEPDLVRALLARIVDDVPDQEHLLALHVAGHANVTTETLLRDLVPHGDTAALFGWLRGLSFVEQTPRGLRPHDVVRTALDADLRWRDPGTYAVVHRAVREHQVQRARSGNPAERRQAVADTIFQLRDHPIAGAYWDWGLLGEGYDEPLTDHEFDAAVTMAGRRYGPAQIRALRHWLERQPQAFRGFYDSAGDLVGFAGYLSLDAATAEDIRADPATAALWEYVHDHGPPRPGEQVKAWRFLVDRDVADERERQTAGTLLGVWHALDILLRGPTAWDFIATYTDVVHWSPFLGHLDFHHVPQAGFRLDGTEYAVFAHDWRRVGVDAWLDTLLDRELSDRPAEPEPPAADVVVLSQEEFTDAVKDALRHLHDPSALRPNPLLESALVRDAVRTGEDRAGEDLDGAEARTPEAVLREMVVAASEVLRDRPRVEHLYRVLDRTFLRPAPSQEKAAEILGLPFSTYRRHRDRAVGEVARWLWEREVYGPDAHRLDTPAADTD